MNRLHADYWIRKGLPPAGRRRGQVFISYSSLNEARNGLVRRFSGLLKPVLELAGEAPVYVYTHPVSGSRYGVSFVEEVVERIAHAPAAFVFKSAEYFASEICSELELPLLLWRNRVHGMPLYFIYAGASSVEALPVSFPAGNRSGTSKVLLGELGDDRKAHPEFRSVEYLRDQSLQMLLEDGKSAVADARLLAVIADFAQTLKLPMA